MEGHPPAISGHIWRRDGKRGAVWYAKYRLADGRQVQRRIGRAWTHRGPAPPGQSTRTEARAYLARLLADVRARPNSREQTVDFSAAAAEWLAYCEGVRDCKDSTLRDYRHMVAVLKRSFAKRPLSSISAPELEAWIEAHPGANRTRQKYLVCLSAIFRLAQRRHGLIENPAAAVERPRVRRPVQIEVLNPRQVGALISAAVDESDACAFALAALAGLRIGEILALRWRDLSFERHTIHVRENWTRERTTTPKSGQERTVPMADELAEHLLSLREGAVQRGEDQLVLCTPDGGHLGYKSLKRRYREALRSARLPEDFRFHNLRHTFGTTVIRNADAREVMEWMGHADLATTRRYLAFIDHADAARRISAAFADLTQEFSGEG
jgi:integrase